MKKLVSITIIALFAISSFAQEHQKGKHYEFTTDQIAELRTKKMALHLDLTENQQVQILEINKKNIAERKQKKAEHKTLKQSGKELTSEQVFQNKSKRLDKQITHKAKMKKILNAEQFELWKKTRKNKRKIAKRKIQQKK